MLDSIYVSMSGLSGFEEGLKVISNNSANLNTPGFKSSTLQFADLFYDRGAGGMSGGMGEGVNTFGTTLNFTQGELRQTGNAQDLAVDGQGLFTLSDADGKLHYTRAGQFQFDATGTLVDRTSGMKVASLQGTDGSGIFTLDGHLDSAAHATATITFQKVLSTGQQQVVMGTVPVIDAAGNTHNLNLTFDNLQLATPPQFGKWTLTLKDQDTVVGTSTLKFNTDGTIDTSFAEGNTSGGKVTLNYTTPAGAVQPLTLDFSTDVKSQNQGGDGSSNLTVSKQDGYGAGALTGATFDATGTLVFTYSNGQTAKGDRIRLARFDSTVGVEAVGGNEYDPKDTSVWHFGSGGDPGFGAVKSGTIEISNVNLSQEFSDLVIMQRGYQACSQVITTANEMLQQLFSMSSNR